MKCRKGLRVLGADVSGSSSWQITVDVSQKRRSATVTASTSADTADKLAHKFVFICVIELTFPRNSEFVKFHSPHSQIQLPIRDAQLA